MAKRRSFTAAFKARVAKQALRGDKTAQQIAAQHGVHPNQVSEWKRKASEGLVELVQRLLHQLHVAGPLVQQVALLLV